MSALGRLRRRIDRRFYRLLNGAYRLAFPSDVAGGPIAPRALRRVLIVPREAVGDLVVITPVLDFLRDVAPQARVDVLASRRNASLLAGDPRVGRLLVADAPDVPRWRLLRALRREGYDLVVSAGHSQHARQGRVAALVAGRTGARVTWFRPVRYWGLFTHVARAPGFERRHIAERLLHAVQQALGVHDASAAPRYPMSLAPDAAALARVRPTLDAAAGRPFVAINCWASKPYRRLDGEQTVALVRALARRHPGLAFVLTPPPGADAEARAIADAARGTVGDAAPVVAAPSASQLTDLVALLSAAAVVLTPDTANVHIASALGRPVVALFASTRPDPFYLWRPFGVAHRVLAAPTGGTVGDIAPAAIADACADLVDEVCGGAPVAHAAR